MECWGMTKRAKIKCEVVRDERGELSIEVYLPDGMQRIDLNGRLPVCKHLDKLLDAPPVRVKFWEPSGEPMDEDEKAALEYRLKYEPDLQDEVRRRHKECLVKQEEDKESAAHELLIQKTSDKQGVKWPCVCRVNPREKEGDLLCSDCWAGIPLAKREGLARLRANDDDIVEYTMAAEQILRIAEKNLERKREGGA